MNRREKNPYESSTFGNALSLRVDGAIGAMSLSPNGRDAVLAGRRGLFIIDLDDPFAPPRWLHHITSWEVADVQWSPHHSIKPSWCISTSNQKALLWDLARPSNNAIVNVLHEHSRAITDINFHPFDPEVLATCSVDMFVLGWDMRTPRRPVYQWAEWKAGATQVKWNHKNPYEIASSHDNNLYIWDSRKGSLPLIKVEKAHNGKINGIDFSGGLSNIITCSNDKTAKFWNLLDTRSDFMTNTVDYFESKKGDFNKLYPTIIINCDYPIARARAVPFGADKSCGIMPLRGGNNAINIVNYDKEYEKAAKTKETQHITADPDYSFKGHNGAIKDFLWRQRHNKYEGIESKQEWSDYQLVTWSSQDFDLKLWSHKDELYNCVNYNPSYKKIVGTFEEEDTGENKDNFADRSILTQEKKKYKIPSPSSYQYNTYRVEPTVTLEDIQKRQNGDILSSLALYHMAKTRNRGYASQLNHLHWISGVRMGKSSHSHKIESGGESADAEDGPTNLGEEVSIVGHKFPKVHFEKISVSTGDLILSLKGPVPNIPINLENSIVLEQNEDKKAVESPADDKDSSKEEKIKNDAPTSNPNEVTSNRDTKKAEKSIPSTNINSSKISSVMNSANSEPKELESASNEKTQSPLVTEDPNQNQEQKLIFIRLQIRFPEGYPCTNERSHSEPNDNKTAKSKKQKLVYFNIEETHELTSAIKQQMQKKLSEIANFYTNRFEKFCLEPCLRYLMGDKVELDESLMVDPNEKEDNILPEESVEEVGTEGWADDLIRQQPDFKQMSEFFSGDEDADEDEDLIPNVDASLFNSESQNMDRSNDNDEGTATTEKEIKEIADISANKRLMDSTPIPKGCGAVWSNTGQLVCFFIPKNNESENTEMQKFNIFKFTDGGFSLKTYGSNHSDHNNKHQSSDSISNDELLNKNNENFHSSDDEDIGSVTSDSSDDSFSEEWNEMNQNDIPSRSRIPGLFKSSVGLGGRFISHENMKQSYKKYNSQGGTASNYKSSAAPEENTRSKKKKERSKKNSNIVGIFDFSHLIPSKLELAREYRVLGDSPENLARYNSGVALKYGLNDISRAWGIVEMILVKTASVNPYFVDFTRSQKLLSRSSHSQQDASLSFGNSDISEFFWGKHPFGYTWLVKEMMDYFKLEGNIQMLATLSCILYENRKNLSNTSSHKVPVHTPYTTLPLPPPPSAPAIKGLSQNNQHRLSQYEPGSYMNDASSNNHLSINGEGRGSFSYNKSDNESLIDGSYNKPADDSLESIGLKEVSPEKFSFFKRKGTHNSSTNGTNSLNEIVRTDSSTSLVKPKSSKYWSPKQRTEKGIDKKRTRPSIQGQESHRHKVRAEPLISLELNNTDELDLFEDTFTSPLLDSKNEPEIRRYREQYAEMLYVWGLPINRIKVLKFNYSEGTNDKFLKGSTFRFHECSFGISEPTRNRNEHSESVVLKNKSQGLKSLKFCSFCNLCVTKSLVICFDCEHALHLHCAIEWWSKDEENEYNQFCPSGCGCECNQTKSI